MMKALAHFWSGAKFRSSFFFNLQFFLTGWPTWNYALAYIHS